MTTLHQKIVSIQSRIENGQLSGDKNILEAIDYAISSEPHPYIPGCTCHMCELKEWDGVVEGGEKDTFKEYFSTLCIVTIFIIIALGVLYYATA